MNLTMMQIAWIAYAAGGLGLCLATWWMFLWAWRFVRYSAVITVITLLFTPYAIDAQTMQMAPAIYTLIFSGMAQGLDAILPLIKLMVGIWSIGVILAAVFVLLTRKSSVTYSEPATANRSASARKASERSTSERRPSERSSTARNSADRSPTERSPTDRNSAGRHTNKRGSEKQAPAPSHKKTKKKSSQEPRRDYFALDNLSREERQARDEMLQGDVPMRAIRD